MLELVRTAWRRPGLVCLLLGLLGTLPLVVLTPPFHVPDENQHFLRAYQLSELQFTAVMKEGEARSVMPASLEARVMLPSSLIELVESFSGTRVVFNPGPTSAQPLHRTWLELDRPLDLGRRELVSLPFTMKAPPSYVPQAIAMAVGRWLGAGPLALLYSGRLANALVAVIVLAWAVQLMPIGRELTMLFGLLPMATYEYASVSADATVITSAFLFTALALRAQLRGRWNLGEVALAVVSGLVFCTQKPVYAPLLLVGLPAALVRGRAKHTLLVHAVITLIVLGATAAWLRFTARYSSLPLGVSVSGQATFIAAHPFAYARTIARSFWYKGYYYYHELVGVFGWLALYLPNFAYLLALGALLLGTLAQPRDGPRLPTLAVAWNAVVLAAACILIFTAAYLLWNEVGSWFIWIVSGRYFLPLLALVAAMWCSAIRLGQSRRASLAALMMLVMLIIAQSATTVLTIVRAYHVL
jgi:uncharacterized membrane protein